MNEMKWAWVLFVAASLAVLFRLAMWFLPAPAVQHAEELAAAADPGIVEDVLPPPPEAVWPEEAEEDPVWTVEATFEWPEMPAPLPEEEHAPPPEEFYFRRTRWGMSMAEVLDAEMIRPLRKTDRGLLYSTTTLELPCLLTYSFVQDRLVRARLSFSDPTGEQIPPLSVAQAQRRFLFLREQLRIRYGEPVERTLHVPRDTTILQRHLRHQDELTKQYDLEIAEAQERIRRQRTLLEKRYERWQNRAEMVARGLAPYERDLRELRTWKQEAIDLANQARRSIQEQRSADASEPLVAVRAARWPFARDIHDIDLRLDLRYATPRLDIRYESAQTLPVAGQMDEL